jgi:hypothetical protein
MRRVADSLSARLKEAKRRVAEGDEALKAASKGGTEGDDGQDGDSKFPDDDLM